jgi:RNase P subunit RPR2
MLCKKCNEPLDMNDVKAVLDFPYVEISFLCKKCDGFNYALLNQDVFIIEEDDESDT